MKEKDTEDRKLLEIIKRDRKITWLKSVNKGKIVIMDRIDYNSMIEKTTEKMETGGDKEWLEWYFDR